jgi:hypothetical protein
MFERLLDLKKIVKVDNFNFSSKLTVMQTAFEM